MAPITGVIVNTQWDMGPQIVGRKNSILCVPLFDTRLGNTGPKTCKDRVFKPEVRCSAR